MTNKSAGLDARLAKPLCVQCRRRTRKAAFGSTSAEAKLSDGAAKSRFVCSHCGSRAATLFRAADDRDAHRWLADR